MQLEIVDGRFSVCKLPTQASIPDWAHGNFVSVTRTEHELSIVVPEDCVPTSLEREDGFAMLRVAGNLDFSLVGILARLSHALADAGISIFVISTFDTDYVMVKASQLDLAKRVLIEDGYYFKSN